MKLYNGISPNGARVEIFLREKGIRIPTRQINLMAGETRTEAYLKINSLGQVPVLELDNEDHLTESVAICRFLEDIYPQPLLFGTKPKEKAFIEMWIRRMELVLFNTLGDIGLHEFEFFKDRIEQNSEYAAAQRRKLIEGLEWFDEEISDGRPFVTGDLFSMADIIGMSMLIIADFARLTLPDYLLYVKQWENRVRARESFPRIDISSG